MTDGARKEGQVEGREEGLAEGLALGEEKGNVKGLREAVLTLMRVRFPDLTLLLSDSLRRSVSFPS